MKEQDTDVIHNRTDDYNNASLHNSPATLHSKSNRQAAEDVASFLDLLKAVEKNNGLRVRKVKKFSRLIDDGSYETEERIDELAERLLDELL